MRQGTRPLVPVLIKRVERLCKSQPSWREKHSADIEEEIFGSKSFLEDNSFSTSHHLVNVYRKPENRYEVRSEDNAVDVRFTVSIANIGGVCKA